MAVVILSVSITLIIQSMTQSLRSATLASHYTSALLLAENKLNEYVYAAPDIDNQEEGFPKPNDKYRYMMEKKPLDDPDFSNLLGLDLKVSWTSRGRDNNISFETFLLDITEE